MEIECESGFEGLLHEAQRQGADSVKEREKSFQDYALRRIHCYCPKDTVPRGHEARRKQPGRKIGVNFDMSYQKKLSAA